MNRDFIFKITRILNFVTAGLMLLLLASFALPYFKYAGPDREVVSMWAYLGFPAQFVQMEELLAIKFVTIKQLNVVLGLIIFGILSAIALLGKKGIGTQFLPLIYCVWGTVGYFTNRFLLLSNTYAYYISLTLILLTFLVVLVNIFFYIKEITTRSAEDYLDLDAWSTRPAMK